VNLATGSDQLAVVHQYAEMQFSSLSVEAVGRANAALLAFPLPKFGSRPSRWVPIAQQVAGRQRAMVGHTARFSSETAAVLPRHPATTRRLNRTHAPHSSEGESRCETTAVLSQCSSI
jgi:hypothetical protein